MIGSTSCDARRARDRGLRDRFTSGGAGMAVPHVTIVVPLAAGSASDIAARVVADQLASS